MPETLDAWYCHHPCQKKTYGVPPFIWHYFTKYLLAPHLHSIGSFQTMVISSTNPEVHGGMDCLEPFRTHPFLQMIGVGMHLEHPGHKVH